MDKKDAPKKLRKTLFLVIAAEMIMGSLAIITSLSFLLIIFRNNLYTFDSNIIHWVYNYRSEAMTSLMKGITFFGGEIFISLGIIIFILSFFKKHKISAFNFGFTLLFGTILNLLLKTVFQRARPEFMPLAHETTYSFPSGHAMNSFIFYSCITYFIVRNTTNTKLRITSIMLFGFIVLLIGLSRVYLGVHYPSDVIAGYIAGILWFVLVLLVEKTAHKFKFFKSS